MGIHMYFKRLSEMERIVRCPGKFKFEEHNVAAHSWKVIQYAQFFATVEEQQGVTINWKRLYDKTVSHDFGEVFIGDIKTPVKHSSPELRKMISHVEEAMVQSFIEEEIPDGFKSVFRERLSDGKDHTVEGMILEFADKLDQVYEAFAELQKGNPEPEFVKMYTNALTKIKDIDLHGVKYFLNEILPEMINEDMMTSVDIKTITEEVLSLP